MKRNNLICIHFEPVARYIGLRYLQCQILPDAAMAFWSHSNKDRRFRGVAVGVLNLQVLQLQFYQVGWHSGATQPKNGGNSHRNSSQASHVILRVDTGTYDLGILRSSNVLPVSSDDAFIMKPTMRREKTWICVRQKKRKRCATAGHCEHSQGIQTSSRLYRSRQSCQQFWFGIRGKFTMQYTLWFWLT